MDRATSGCRGRRPAAAGRFLLAGLATLAAGCTQLSYEQLRLGQELRDAARAFPEGRARRTELGLCTLERDPFGRTDAVVILLTRDRRVAARWHAMHVERRFGFRAETAYSLRGELDPGLVELRGTGPIDTLRALADDLSRPVADPLAREAQGWVAAGLVRLVQHWPHLGDEGPALPRLPELLERVPGGGEARITIRPDGVQALEYRHAVAH